MVDLLIALQEWYMFKSVANANAADLQSVFTVTWVPSSALKQVRSKKLWSILELLGRSLFVEN